MQKVIVSIFLFLLVLAGVGLGFTLGMSEPKTSGYTDRVHTGYVACTSAYYLDQYEQAPHRRQIGMMLNDECLPTDRLTDYPFMVMESGEVSRVRLLLPDDAYAEVYLFDEAIAAVRK